MLNSDILDFWTELTHSYNEWNNEFNTETNESEFENAGIIASDTIFSGGMVPHEATSGPCGTEKAVEVGITQQDQTFNEFCKLQKLTFCDYCQPMCKIHQNCITGRVAVICNGVAQLHGANWSLVQTCCNKCGNYQCEIPTVRNGIDCQPSVGAAFVPIIAPLEQKNDHLLQILMPVLIVTIMSILAVTAFWFRFKRKSIKYKPLCQFEISSESEVSAEADDRTNISITELWNQINNKNDEKDSIKMKTIKNNAPLACVLRSSDNSDSEV